MINANRIVPRRFPTVPKEEDIAQIMASERWDEAERRWLAGNAERYTEKPSFEQNTVLKMHQDLTDVERQYAVDLSANPEREDYLFALFEVSKDAIIQKFLKANFKFHKGRIVDQVRSGTIML